MQRTSQQRIRNWGKYNSSLVARGRVTVWIGGDARAGWNNTQGSGQRGRVKTYSDSAILCVLTIQAVYGQTLRGAQGMVESLFEMMGTELSVPNYTTICRRRASLKIPLAVRRRKGEALHVVVDSTGFKVYGEGEWKVRKHGWSKRRTWRKLHIGVDESSLEIVSAVGTGNDCADKEMLSSLLDDIEEPLDQVSGDGGYDARDCYEAITQRGARAVIPPQRNAKLWKHDPRWDQRNKNLLRIRELETVFEDEEEGRKQWKQETDYHRRSLVETTMMRLKTIFGAKLTPRIVQAQDSELLLRCRILNQMTHLGMPEYDKR
jgi:hypothetical protein